MRRAFFFGVVACALGFGATGGLGCSSGDDDSGGTGGTGATGGMASYRNLYVAQVLGGTACLPRPLQADSAGHVPCTMVEARVKSPVCACDGTQGRVPVTDSSVVPNVLSYMQETLQCGAAGTPACSDYCYCELQQFSGGELLTCEGSATDPGTQYGFCYVDPQIDSNADGAPDANPAILADCKDTEKRKLRFLGSDVPASDALVFLTCESATAAD